MAASAGDSASAKELHSASTGPSNAAGSQASRRERVFMASLEGNAKENIVHFHFASLKGAGQIS
ncbi:hypothetical protein D9M73_264220 [compost metagenome]